MDRKQFAEKVSNPMKFTSQERGWLKAVQSKYPFSSVVGTLALLADHAYGFDTVEERRAVALSVCNPSVLDVLLDGAVADAGVAAEPASVVEDQSFDVLNEINTFQEVSFKTAPKSVILSNFLPFGAPEEGGSEGLNGKKREINDKKSIVADESLGTETLAIVLKNQGRYDKALAIYKNLLAHNPEKSSIFAPRIEELKRLKNSK